MRIISALFTAKAAGNRETLPQSGTALIRSDFRCCPILCSQRLWDFGECLTACHERRVDGNRMGSDHHVERRESDTLGFATTDDDEYYAYAIALRMERVFA